MGIGALIRRSSGPLEPVLTDAYRLAFFDLDDFAMRIAVLSSRGPREQCPRIIEIGCGEGLLLSRLRKLLPDALLLGADPSPAIGRQFGTPWSQVELVAGTAKTLVEKQVPPADLVVLCDVLHHIPVAERREIIRAAAGLVAPGGRLVIKEWTVKLTPVFWIGWASDRFVTGDRVAYWSASQWISLVESSTPDLAMTDRMPLRPWRCNEAFVFERGR